MFVLIFVFSSFVKKHILREGEVHIMQLSWFLNLPRAEQNQKYGWLTSHLMPAGRIEVTGSIFPFRVMKGDGFCCFSVSTQLTFH